MSSRRSSDFPAAPDIPLAEITLTEEDPEDFNCFIKILHDAIALRITVTFLTLLLRF
ncbi:MAG: hypothetical protein F6K28_56135 [Microcoleus sp. SIO2G3]|nr:hypothetical protein [Microcoleus sp. SIO2G3]